MLCPMPLQKVFSGFFQRLRCLAPEASQGPDEALICMPKRVPAVDTTARAALSYRQCLCTRQAHHVYPRFATADLFRTRTQALELLLCPHANLARCLQSGKAKAVRQMASTVFAN